MCYTIYLVYIKFTFVQLFSVSHQLLDISIPKWNKAVVDILL